MTLTTQFLTMLSMIGMGAIFGMMLDTYQRFLHRGRRKNWIVFFNDLFFWIFQAFIIFYILFLINKGEIRFYIFLALLCGFAAYQSLIKSIFLKLLEFIISSFISLYHFIKKMVIILIFKPFRGLFKLVKFILLLLGTGIITLVKFVFQGLLFIVKLILTLVVKILLIFWKLFPKGIKNSVDKLYNKAAGNFKALKNTIVNRIKKWTKKK